MYARIVLFFLMGWLKLFCLGQLKSQPLTYLPNEKSLEKRATPAWFNNAKLGIFIHWGLYSVPAWATPTTTPDKVTDWRAFYKSNPYAEWYLNSLRINESPTQVHHEKIYGKNYNYYNFKDSLMHKTVKWNANSWANLFAKIGAKYVVLTSKHHDGFTLYPSKIVNPFMAKNTINSNRDFVGELANAVRKKGLKYGVYYSGGLDWTFNQDPITNLWPDLFEAMPKSMDYTAYADAQLKELIRTYKPDILWNDINYPKNGDLLSIFAELFNSNSNAVINERWGQYQTLTNFTTPEYEVLDSIAKNKWETCRGLGYSFGYNQIENDTHLLSSTELVQLLIDIVSKNGNLLLNIGPKADGSIPENQLQRLIDLGKWMNIYSEGIYDTHPYKIASLKLSDGTPLRFTQKQNQLYIFLLSTPKSNTVFLPSCKLVRSAQLLLYGTRKTPLAYTIKNNGILIKLPPNFRFEHAAMIRIKGVVHAD